MNSNDTVLALYKNSHNIQSTILDDMEARITGGAPIIDANNVASHLMEQFSVVSSDIVSNTMRTLEVLYPKRAQTAKDLYKHMSDFDYVNLFSTPSSLSIELILPKQQLIDGALSFNDNYKKVIIPKNTIFTIDQYQFSLYYPIEIRINKRSETFIVSYDNTEKNPLHTLTNNTLEHRVNNYYGLDVLSIMIPIYQMVRAEHLENVSPDNIFDKDYTYENNFYAARIWTNNGPNGEYTELLQTLSGGIYDPKTPTAKLLVDPQTNVLNVSIPQIYLTTDSLGTRLKIEILTTYGEVDADVTEITPESMSVVFTSNNEDPNSAFTSILKRPEIIQMRPVSNKIIGGSNGISFEHLRQRVIHDSFTEDVLISPPDLVNHFSDQGFKVTKYQDGITRRIYVCHKEITDRNGVVLPSAPLETSFTLDDFSSINSITDNTEGSFTVLPHTIYRYNRETNTAEPITDADRIGLESLGRDETIEEFNRNTYTFNPFFVRVDTSGRYPMAYTYDLTDPTIKAVEFLKENVNITSQLSIFHASISHPTVNGAHKGFVMDLLVERSQDILEIDQQHFKVVLTGGTEHEINVIMEGTYIGEDQGKLLYRFNLDSNYRISKYHDIEISSLFNAHGSPGQMIKLESDFDIHFFIKTDQIDVPVGSRTDVANIIADRYPTHTPVTDQRVELKLGQLVDEAFSRVTLLTTSKEYATYAENVYATYDRDVYETDANGVFVYNDDGTNIELVVKHQTGDIIYDQTPSGITLTENNIHTFYDSIVGALDSGIVLSSSNKDDYIGTIQSLWVPRILHREGDTRFDGNSAPIIANERKQIYAVNLIHVDNKLTKSARPEHINIVDNISDLLRTYFEVTRRARNLLIEETEIYFQPMRSIGNAAFKRDRDTTTSFDLELSVKLKVYVYQHVYNNISLLNSIRTSVLAITDEAVREGTVTMTDLANRIVSQLSDMVKFVDVLGINDDVELQTLIQVDETVIPNIKHILEVEDDGTIGVARDLNIEFVAVDIE